MVGVVSFDLVNEDRDTSGDPPCSTHFGVFFYRNWTMKARAGEVPRSECKMPPKQEPSLLPPDLSVCEKACSVLSRHALLAALSLNWIRSSAAVNALRPQHRTMSHVHAVFVGAQEKPRKTPESEVVDRRVSGQVPTASNA